MQATQQNRVRFTANDVEELSAKLDAISKLTDISWEFTDDELTVSGLDIDPIKFASRYSARAGLDLYLLGHQHGFEDGKYIVD